MNAVKEMFEMPKLDIIALADEDIIRTSTDRGQWDINVKSGIDRCEILQYNIIERLNFDDFNAKSSVPKPIL